MKALSSQPSWFAARKRITPARTPKSRREMCNQRTRLVPELEFYQMFPESGLKMFRLPSNQLESVWQPKWFATHWHGSNLRKRQTLQSVRNKRKSKTKILKITRTWIQGKTTQEKTMIRDALNQYAREHSRWMRVVHIIVPIWIWGFLSNDGLEARESKAFRRASASLAFCEREIERYAFSLFGPPKSSKNYNLIFCASNSHADNIWMTSSISMAQRFSSVAGNRRTWLFRFTFKWNIPFIFAFLDLFIGTLNERLRLSAWRHICSLYLRPSASM